MSGTSEKTTPVNVRLDNTLKARLDALHKETGQTLTAIVRRLVEALVEAWEATPEEPANVPLIVYLTQAQYAAATRRAGGQGNLSPVVRQVLSDWSQRARITPATYPSLPALTAVVDRAVLQMLQCYLKLPPYHGDLVDVLAAALASVDLREMVDQLIRTAVAGLQVYTPVCASGDRVPTDKPQDQVAT